MDVDPRLDHIVAAQPYPLIFATISGAHLYGFPSPDSDYDLRGAHVLPLDGVVGLEVKDETVQDERVIDGLEMDIVSHDAKKFFSLLLKKNGYVLEQLYSPLIVHTTPEHEELKAICSGDVKTATSPRPSPPQAAERENRSQPIAISNVGGVITKHHSHHYFGFSETQWKLFEKERPRRVKPLLYVYRVLLTGIHLMRTGVVNANLGELNEETRLPYIADLIARKQSGENTTLEDADIEFHQHEYERLRIELQKAHDESKLPEVPSDKTRAALNDLLVRVRVNGLRAAK
jgi:uncharacterized protein